MDNYLIDREALAQFVDGLMKQKPLPANTPEELNNLRENAIKELDDRLGLAIFDSLSEEQLDQINQLLDDPTATPEAFQQFFTSAGLDLQKIISDAMTAFGKEFLGGQNE